MDIQATFIHDRLQSEQNLEVGLSACFSFNGGTCVVGFVHGSSLSEASRRGSGVNKQMDLVFYLFLTGVCEVAEPSDTSTPNGSPLLLPWEYFFSKTAKKIVLKFFVW